MRTRSGKNYYVGASSSSGSHFAARAIGGAILAGLGSKIGSYFTPRRNNTRMIGGPRGRRRANSILRIMNSARRKYTPRRVSQIQRRLNQTKRLGASNSKSKGRFTVKRRRLNKGQRLNVRAMNRGISVTKEVGTVFTGTECVYIGHATMPQALALQQFCRAIIKFFIMKSNVQVEDTDALNTPLYIGDTIRIEYRRTPDDLTTQNITYTVVTTGESVETAASATAAAILAVTNLGDVGTFNPGEAMFDQVNYSAGQASRMRTQTYNARLSVIQFDVKSTLKIQNRTINAATGDGESDEVDNVPLYGKSYGGAGCGAEYRSKLVSSGVLAYPLIADNGNGIITVDGSSVEALKEPPNPKQWLHVKRQGKIHLDPGEIKTSVLNFSRGYTVNTFLKEVLGRPFIAGTVSNYTWSKMGNYNMFGLEKMIDATAGIPMVVALEHNIRMGTFFKPRNNFMTTPVFEKVII